MATPKQKWMIGLAAIAAVAAVAVATNVGTKPAPVPVVESVKAACRSTADCPTGSECVAPGRCSQACKSDSDCPAGRKCAELRAMQADADGTATTVTTCVVATPAP